MPSPFTEILNKVEKLSQGGQYGSRVTFMDGKYHICNGQRPFVWQPIDCCDGCGRRILKGDDAHWDEINNRIVCMGCHGS